MRVSRPLVGGIVLALFLAVAGGSAANDSTSELATGGLVLTHNTAIEMQSEDLYISPTAVRVRYRFVNTSPRDVTVTVAFPMPDITTNGFDDLLAVPTDNPTNFLAFATRVDGRPVPAQVQQKVFKDGIDRTAYLRGLGLPLAPHLEATNAAINRLPRARQDELMRLGLAQNPSADDAKDAKRELTASWTLKTTFYWNQTFPAGRPVIVEHDYKPAVGESAGTIWGTDYGPTSENYAAQRRHYCVDDAFIASAGHLQHLDGGDMSEQRIEYILSTAANWKAPIGSFHMVIDKGDPTNLISFCGDGVRKTGPTTFEVTHTNFTPTREVSVLILKRMARR